MQGKVEAYGKESELPSQGVNPAHLLGLMKKAQKEDQFEGQDSEEDIEDLEEMEEDELEGKTPHFILQVMYVLMMKQ